MRGGPRHGAGRPRKGWPGKTFTELRELEAQAVQRIAEDILQALRAGPREEEDLRERLCVASTFRWKAAIRTASASITIEYGGLMSLKGTSSMVWRGWDSVRRTKLA